MGIHQRPAEDPSLQSQRHQVKKAFFVNNKLIVLILKVGARGGGRVPDCGQQHGGEALGDRQREQKDEL